MSAELPDQKDAALDNNPKQLPKKQHPPLSNAAKGTAPNGDKEMEVKTPLGTVKR